MTDNINNTNTNGEYYDPDIYADKGGKNHKRTGPLSGQHFSRRGDVAHIDHRRIPKPPNWLEMHKDEQDQYIIQYLSNQPVEDLLKMVKNQKRRNFIFAMADPRNADKSPEKLYKEAGYKNMAHFTSAMSDPITNHIIYRLRNQHIYNNLKAGSKLLEKRDVLAILSTIVAQYKVPLQDGKMLRLQDQSLYFKALDNLLKYHGLHQPQYHLNGDVQIQIKLPERQNTNNVKPIEKLYEGETIDVESEEVDHDNE